MPYSVSNPVNFYAGGDTTSQAIGKHIAEIARIYEIINSNSLSAGGATIVTSDDVVLKAGEIGFDRNTGTLKVGDGSTRWGDLLGINVVEVVNDLLSDDATKALSAAQGKALKGLIDGIPKTEVVDDLLSDEGAKALSAAQGKVLKALIDAIEIPQPGPPGPKGLKWCGAWDADAEYQEDDAVSYMGGSYIAIKASSNKEPPDAEYWGILSAKGADGTGTGDMTKAVYDPDGDGKVDAAVVADHAGAANTATRADTADAVAWDNVTGKPEKFTCDIVDALDSDRADAALSAKQGKALKGFVDEKANVTHTHEIDDITQLAATLQNKADLVNGKVPETQLPSSIGNGLSAPTTSTFLAFGCSDKTGSHYVLPPGGTWLYWCTWVPKTSNTSGMGASRTVSSIRPGGNSIIVPSGNGTGEYVGFAWRIQ